MQLRYMGFAQASNTREYKYDALVQGEVTQHFVVSADLALFQKYRVGIQEGPALCMRKLSADLAGTPLTRHELTDEDLLAFAAARAAAGERRPGPRKSRSAAP